MTTPTQILAENAQRPPAEWLPEYLRALAKMEQLAYYNREVAKMEAFLALMERFERELSLHGRNPDTFFLPLPPEIEATRKELLKMCEDMHLDDAGVKCDCNFGRNRHILQGQSVAPVSRT